MFVLLKYINLLHSISDAFGWAWALPSSPWGSDYATILNNVDIRMMLWLLLKFYTKCIWTVIDGGRVSFVRLMFLCKGELYFDSLQIRGVSTIQGFLMYTSIGNLILNLNKTPIIQKLHTHPEVPIKSGSTVCFFCTIKLLFLGRQKDWDNSQDYWLYHSQCRWK